MRLGVDDRWSAIRDLRPLRGALADALDTVAPDVVHAEDLVPAGYAAARVGVAGRPTVVTATAIADRTRWLPIAARTLGCGGCWGVGWRAVQPSWPTSSSVFIPIAH